MIEDYGALNADIIYEPERSDFSVKTSLNELQAGQYFTPLSAPLISPQILKMWKALSDPDTRRRRLDRMGAKRRLKLKLAAARSLKWHVMLDKDETKEYLSWFPWWKRIFIQIMWASVHASGGL